MIHRASRNDTPVARGSTDVSIEYEMQSSVRFLDRQVVFWTVCYALAFVGAMAAAIFYEPFAAVIAIAIAAVGVPMLAWRRLRLSWQFVECRLDDAEVRIRRLNMNDDPRVPKWTTRKGMKDYLFWIDLLSAASPRSTFMSFGRDKDTRYEGAAASIRWDDVQEVRLRAGDERIELRNSWRTVVPLPYSVEQLDAILAYIARHVGPDVTIPRMPDSGAGHASRMTA